MAPPPGHLRSQYQHQQHQYQRPATTTTTAAAGASGGGGSAAAAPSSIVSAAQAAAAAINAGKAAPAARPAYISVASGTLAAPPGSRVPALNPQNWPPAVKSYVERAFKAAPFRQRTKLQDVLRTVISDAQDKGKR